MARNQHEGHERRVSILLIFLLQPIVPELFQSKMSEDYEIASPSLTWKLRMKLLKALELGRGARSLFRIDLSPATTSTMAHLGGTYGHENFASSLIMVSQLALPDTTSRM
jgi:hypothetical protein